MDHGSDPAIDQCFVQRTVIAVIGEKDSGGNGKIVVLQSGAHEFIPVLKIADLFVNKAAPPPVLDQAAVLLRLQFLSIARILLSRYSQNANKAAISHLRIDNGKDFLVQLAEKQFNRANIPHLQGIVHSEVFSF